MTTPYFSILSAITDHLRTSDPFVGPPGILVIQEAEEPSAERPGESDDVTPEVNAALDRAGVAVVVFIRDIAVTEQGADVVEIHVQVVEHVVNNRSPSGTGKPNLLLVHAVRGALEGQQFESTPEWSQLIFTGIDTISISGVIVRECKFNAYTFMSSAT